MDETFHPAYYNTVDQIFHAQWSITKLGRLELLRRSVRALWPAGHPTRLVQVAGTSGKGSTCRFLELGFALAGKAGAFMGPHLFDYRERFSINGAPPSQDDIIAAWEETVRPLCIDLALRDQQHTHSFHEVNILMALVLFARHQVEWAAIETGVGGRYDQATALDVVATLLTNVGRDHEHLLGQEPWQRALDKVGIARRGVPLFTSERDPGTLRLIAAVCRHMDAPLVPIDETHITRLNDLLTALPDGSLPADALLNADHQRWNAALSLAVLRQLVPELDEQQVLAQFRAARLVGRSWQVADGIYADVAHNPEKIAALVHEISRRFGDAGKIFVVGVAGKRSPASLLAPLVPVAKAIVVTSTPTPGQPSGGQDPHRIKQAIAATGSQVPTLVVAEPRQALEVARSLQKADDIIILTGSTYMIDQALNPDPHLRYLNATYGWRTQQDIPVEGSLHFVIPQPPAPK